MDSMIIVGNPDNKRTRGVQEARRAAGLPPALVMPYMELLEGKSIGEQLARADSFEEAGAPLIRIDAPGEHFEVERGLIALGAPDAEDQDDRLLPLRELVVPHPLSVQAASRLREHTGQLYHPSQWFRGYARLLASIERDARTRWPEARFVNEPAAIAGMFDKRHAHTRLTEAGVAVPRRLAEPAELPDYEALREMMRARRMPRVFVKLAAGSGACGIIAYQVNPATGAEIAITTIGVENYIAKPPVYYNALKPRRCTDSAIIRQMINWLLRHGSHVEQWIAKAAVNGRPFDIRQLVVGGEACHSLARISRTPFTNLHLRSERQSLDEMGLRPVTVQSVREIAERATAAFTGASVAGVDVLLSAGSLRPYVLDVNPFGDLLYRVSHEGLGTYEWQIKQLARQEEMNA
ncbi:STM4014 family protein [Paenibacillus xanthanilyticus]|uniref:STM4014 family protein n=1 Tax=Paenibacillus xanthanilyticus TaxID=1783531 RepID=A0ABV8K695_9BACL